MIFISIDELSNMMSGEYLSVISRRLPSIRSVSQQMFEFEHKIYYYKKKKQKQKNNEHNIYYKRYKIKYSY